MDCNACSTRLALHWMKASCNKTADAEKAAFFVNRMRFALGRFAMTFRVASDGFEIQVENWQNLFVDNAFLACNLQRNLRTTHLSVEQAWGSQWDSMLTDSDLQMPWSSQGLPLQSVLRFALTVERVRRRQQKPPWKTRSADCLSKLQSGLMAFLIQGVEMTVNQDRSPFLGRNLPKRKFCRPGPGTWNPNIQHSSRHVFVSSPHKPQALCSPIYSLSSPGSGPTMMRRLCSECI